MSANSNEPTTIIERLIAVQRTLQNPKRTKTGQIGNRQYAYAPLDESLDVIRKACNENGLFLTQSVFSPDVDVLEVTTEVRDTDGHEMPLGSARVSVAGLNTQDQGKVITYLRRYLLFSAFSIVGEEDDDAAGVPAAKPVKHAKAETAEGMTAPQRAKIQALAKEIGLTADDLHSIMEEHFGKTSGKDLTKHEASVLIEVLLGMKPPADGYESV